MIKPQHRYAIGSLVIVVALTTLIVSSMQSNTLRSIPVHELRAADTTSQSLVGQRLRVVGFVADTPVRKSPEQTPSGVVSVHHFDVVDGGQTIAVSYRDALPDTFRAGGPVQIDGDYIAPGKLAAEHVFTKCPSKYDAKANGAEADGAKSYDVKPAGAKPEELKAVKSTL